MKEKEHGRVVAATNSTYAEAVDLSRQHTVGYSAQQPAQEYRDRGDVFRLRVRVFFTDTYSLSTYAQTATQKDSKLRKDVRSHSSGGQVQLSQGDRLIEPLEIPGIPVFRSYTVGDAYFGFEIILHYDGEEIASDNAKVVSPYGRWPAHRCRFRSGEASVRLVNW